ncbi:MAG: hypothetical protein ACHQ53_15890 [Polyangiales bacterium]
MAGSVQHPRPRALLPCVACALVIAASSPAHASPLFELLGGVGGEAGLNGRIAGPSAASTYFDPALLPRAEPGVQTGVFVLSDAIQLSLDGRSGVDVPTAYRGATHADGSVFSQPSLPTRWLTQGCKPPECTPSLVARPRQSDGSSNGLHAYQSLGLVAAIVPKRLVFGVYALVPLSQFTTAHSFFVDEREQFFTNSLHPELYADRLTATSLAFGLGGRLTSRLSLGVALALGLRNTARAETFVGNADDLSHSLVLTDNVGVETTFSPHFAAVYDATERLRFSVTAHSTERFAIRSAVSTFLPDGNRQTAVRTAIHDYMPWRVGLGASFDVLGHDPAQLSPSHELSLCATAVASLWSDYLDRQGDRPLTGYGWSNTVSVGLGARHSYGNLHSFLDFLFVPTPVPPQTGRTNYVDNDRISAAGGVEYDFRLLGAKLRAGALAQVHVLLPRDQRKLDPTDPDYAGQKASLVRDEFPDDAVDTRGDPIPSAKGLQTNNPGWPGFSSRGLLLGGGLTLAALF